jgi:hypothetical protein
MRNPSTYLSFTHRRHTHKTIQRKLARLGELKKQAMKGTG